MTTNKERPILFNGEMVRAILNGNKTQTRRIMAPQPEMQNVFLGGRHCNSLVWKDTAGPDGWLMHNMCPYGRKGDRLWVRETWRTDDSLNGKAPSTFSGWPVRYEADGKTIKHGALYGNVKGKTRVSIHMPRWASRILLEIVSVRIERLQSISEADAEAEGIEELSAGLWSLYGMRSFNATYSPKSSFYALWESINGKESRVENPWVWVVEFKQVEQKP